MPRWRVWLVVPLALMLTAAGRSDQVVHHPHAMYGRASFYSWWHHGRLMANGHRFNALGLTAASRWLPLGSWVRITNLSNGRHAVVEITDRGPYVRGRILDASFGAARQLGMVQAGVTRVRVEPIDRPVWHRRARAGRTS